MLICPRLVTLSTVYSIFIHHHFLTEISQDLLSLQVSKSFKNLLCFVVDIGRVKSLVDWLLVFFYFSSLSFWNPNKLFDVAVFLSLDSWSCLQHPTEMEKCLMGNFGLPNRPARAGNSSHSSLLSPYICQKAPEHGWVLRGSPHCPLLPRLPLSTSPLRGPGLSTEAHGGFPSATLSSLTDISWTLASTF